MFLLITAADITARTTAELNVEAHKLEVAVPLAQRRHLRPLLTRPLFDALLDFAASSPERPGPDATDAEATAYATALDDWRADSAESPLLALWDEIKDMLCTWALVEAWPGLLGHITNAGFVLKVGKSEGTTSADVVLTNRMEGSLRETAAFLGGELADWLEEHRADYANYKPVTPRPTGELLIGGLDLG